MWVRVQWKPGLSQSREIILAFMEARVCYL